MSAKSPNVRSKPIPNRATQPSVGRPRGSILHHPSAVPHAQYIGITITPPVNMEDGSQETDLFFCVCHCFFGLRTLPCCKGTITRRYLLVCLSLNTATEDSFLHLKPRRYLVLWLNNSCLRRSSTPFTHKDYFTPVFSFRISARFDHPSPIRT